MWLSIRARGGPWFRWWLRKIASFFLSATVAWDSIARPCEARKGWESLAWKSGYGSSWGSLPSVPSLATVLAAVGRAPFLDIELKEPPTEAGLDVISAARGTPDGRLLHAVVSSFDAEVLAAVGRRYPAWPRWLNTRDLEATTIGRARDLGCDGIAALWRVIDASSSDRVRAAGLTLAAYTVRRRPTLARLERLGVSAICVEGPALDD